MFPGLGLDIQETVHSLSLDDVLGDYLLRIRGTHLGVESVVWDDFDDRTLFAETETAGGYDLHLVREAVLGQGCLQVLYDQGAFGGFATGTAAAEDLHVAGSFLDAAAFFRNKGVALLPEFEIALRPFLDAREVING